MAVLAPLAAPLLEAGGAEAAGAAAGGAESGLLGGGLGGFMGDHPFLMGNLMGRAMGGGGPASAAQMGPGADASVAEPMVGVTGKTGADMFGEDEVGLATQNRGDNSDPAQQSSSGADVKERGDAPEQLKDVNMSGTGGDGRGGSQDSNEMDGINQQDGGDSELRDTATNAFHSNLPLVLEFAFSDQSGAEHPILKALDGLLESAFPGYKEVEPTEEGGEDTTETGVGPHDPENPTEKLEGDLGQDLDSDGPADTPESKEEDESKRESKRIAREAGYCWHCWGPLDVLKHCASCVTANEEGPWNVGDRVRHVDAPATDPRNFAEIVKVKRTPYGHAYDLKDPSDGSIVPDVPHNSDLVYVDAGKPPVNRMPPTTYGDGRPVFDRTPSIQPGDAEHFGAIKEADVPGPPAATGMGYATDTGAATNITGVPTCPLCHQNHIAGTPCPTPQMQAPVATTPQSPADTNFAMPMQNNKVVTKFVQVHVAEYDADEIDREPDPMHNESYEDGEKPDTGWYEDWQGPDKDDEKHPWVDDSGKPLEEGMTYDMHSTGYAIPDKITVLAVTPNKLTYELEAGDLAYKDTITTDDVYKQGYTFQPSTGDEDPGMETQQPPQRQPLDLEHPKPPRPGDDALPQQDDISSPPTRVSHGPEHFNAQNGDFQAPEDYDEPEADSAYEQNNDWCRACGREYQRDAEGDDGICFHCKQNDRMEDEGHAYLGSFHGDDADSRNWLNDPGPGQGVDLDPATMAKIAGKEYSPREQRQFIDESGTARNLHRLDLEGTHYELEDYGDSLW